MTDHEPPTPRAAREWQRLLASPLSRIAGAGAVAAAVAGLAVLAWAVIETNQGDEESALTVREVYRALEDAIAGDGQILHSTVSATIDGQAVTWIESWVDAENGAMRRHFFTINPVDTGDGVTIGITEIVAGDWSYFAREDGIIGRGEQVENCAGLDTAWLSAFLMCLPDQGVYTSRVEYTLWEGEDVIVLVHETSDTTGSETSTFSAGTPQATYAPELVYRLYIDRQTYLPLATSLDSWTDGQPDPSSPSPLRRYDHEFIPRTPEVAALLDLRASGYGTADSGRLAELQGIAPLYWLGEEYEDESPLHSLVLDDVVIPALNGAAGSLLYSAPFSPPPGILLELWSSEQWASFRASSAGSILDDPDCVTEGEETIGGYEFVLFEMPRIPYPLPSPGISDMEDCWRHALNEGGMPEAGLLFVHQTEAGFVSISTLPPTFYTDAEHLSEMIAAAFQPYEAD